MRVIAMNNEKQVIQKNRRDEDDISSAQTISDIVEIASTLEQWYNVLGRQFGPLSRPQRRMLRMLHVDTKLRVGDLAEQLGLTTAGTTRMLDKLEELGYITRSRIPHSDQRQVYVTLTSIGEQALSEADVVFLGRLQATLTGLNVAERVALLFLLHKVNEQTLAVLPEA
jgi:DNA-binding MarR family transcriptional regulator